jgi:peptidoglycan/LPS O-acetylase OafA/YrhL
VGYISMLDFFRVAVCACVLGQHSFIWTGMANNDIGTGFITILHFTRNAFFFLTGLVVCYAQITRPRSVWGFWIRRYIQIGVPYLAWTVIYVLFTILRPGGEWSLVRSYFWADVRIGYYQLYVIVVLFQFYLVFPFLLKLLQSTSTRTHVVITSLSIAIALFIGTDLHFHPQIGEVGRIVHDIGNGWVWSRNLVSYQAYFVVGVMVAYHYAQVLQFVTRWYRQILAVSLGVGVTTLVWYLVVVAQGASTGSASDVFEPIAILWSFGAIAGFFALCWVWELRRSRTNAGASTTLTTSGASDVSGLPGALGVSGTRSSSGDAPGSRLSRLRHSRLFSITYLAELSGGFYLCHVLFINMVRAALYSGLIGGTHLPWPIRTAVFYVGTAIVGVAFVSLIVRTPLRWVLGGPVRSQQRERDDAEVALRAALVNGASGPSGAGGASGANVQSGANRESGANVPSGRTT